MDHQRYFKGLDKRLFQKGLWTVWLSKEKEKIEVDRYWIFGFSGQLDNKNLMGDLSKDWIWIDMVSINFCHKSIRIRQPEQ